MKIISWKREFYTFSYIVIFIAFFLLHGINAFFGLLPTVVIASLFVKYISISIIILLLSTVLFKNEKKAFIYTIYLLSIFFFFGSFHDWLKSVFHQSRITSYTWLLPILLFLSVGVFFFIRNCRQDFTRLVRYAKWLLIVFAGWEIAVFTYLIIAGKNRINDLVIPTEISAKSIEPENKPDIFFIVFDEYPSSKSLKHEFGFQNDEIDSLFVEAGFFNSSNSKSNYNFTSYSLASTFGLNYLRISPNDTLHEKQLLQSVETIRRNPLTSFFSQQGYNVINLGRFDFKEKEAQTTPYFDDLYLKRVVDDQTLWSRIKRDIWWNFSMKNIFTGQFRIPKSFKKAKELEIRRNLFNYSSTVEQIKIETKKPRFVYTHILLPHAPYFLNASGQQVADSAIIFNTIDSKSAFIGQLMYANTMLKNLVQSISHKKFSRPRAYIIEGDHGFRYFDKAKDGERAFMNLNTFYFSDHDISQLYNGISPVNSFRIILNKYFKTSLPLLADSSVYITDPRKKS